jgi:putative PIN family toxin of toxin-antitoxin system
VIRVTADSNIYVSALHFGGLPLRFLERATDGDFRLEVSAAIITEVVRVLRLKFDWPPEDTNRIEKLILTLADPVRVPSLRIDAIADDPTDNVVLECAVDAGCNYIVSGDKHLLRLETYEGIQILRVADFLRHLDG